jgi:hypothetical protein
LTTDKPSRRLRVTTKVELVGTVRFTVEIREVDLIGEAGSLVGAAQWMVGDELARHFSGFGPITAEVESWDHGEVLAYGAYRDPVKCPVCGGVYVEEGEIKYIEQHGACGACPDLEMEEWER